MIGAMSTTGCTSASDANWTLSKRLDACTWSPIAVLQELASRLEA